MIPGSAAFLRPFGTGTWWLVKMTTSGTMSAAGGFILPPKTFHRLAAMKNPPHILVASIPVPLDVCCCAAARRTLGRRQDLLVQVASGEELSIAAPRLAGSSEIECDSDG